MAPQYVAVTLQIALSTDPAGCLMPPMVDDELIQLIRATTSGDTANGLGSWMCRRCTRGKSGTPSAAMSAGSREPTASSEVRQESKSRSSDTRATPNVASTRVRQESVCGNSYFGVLDASPECSLEHCGRCATCQRPRTKQGRGSSSGKPWCSENETVPTPCPTTARPDAIA